MVASFIIITELEALTVATLAWCLCATTIVSTAIAVDFVASFTIIELSTVASAGPAFVECLITSRHFKLPFLVVTVA